MAGSGTKLPPQNIEAEQSLLGALLIDKDAIIKVGELLNPDHFYRTEQHGRIYQAITELFERREPIDLVTVTEKLRQANSIDIIGGPAYLTTLVNTVPTSAHIEHYAHIIKEHAIRRRLIGQATRLIDNAYDESVPLDQLLDGAEQSIFAVSQESVKRDFVPLKDLLTVSFDRLDELQKNAGKLRGVPTGFRDLDNKLAGMQESNLIIFAARPGQGKCLAYDSKIVHPITGEVKTIQEYFFDQTLPIFTLDDNFKLQKTNISHFVDDGKKDVYEVKTATGREIEVTITHPFLTVGGWKKLGRLMVGEKIATPRAIPVFGNLNLDDAKVKSIAYFLSDGGLTGNCPRFTNINPQITKDFLSAITCFDNVQVRKYDSDGSRAPSYEVVKAEYNKPAIKQRFSGALKCLLADKKLSQYFLSQKLQISPSTVSMWVGGRVVPSEEHSIMIGDYFEKPKTYFLDDNFYGFEARNSVTRWLDELGLWGKLATEKQLPNCIFRLPKQKMALFLNRLFACDGSVYVSKRGPVVSYASSSKRLIYDVQHLLLRFGILSKIRQKKVKYKGTYRQSFEIEIKGAQDILNFISEINILGKEERVSRARALAIKNVKLNNFTKDTIPSEIWKLVLAEKGDITWSEIYRRLGLPATHNMHVGRRNPKRSTILKIAHALNSQRLKDIATSDVFWDKITSIKLVGKKQVYDLTIPETHNFMANDFFVHNTSFVLNVAEYVAVKVGLPVGIFSLEMSQEELVDRLLVGQAEIDAWKLKTGKLDDNDFDRLSHAMGELAEAPLFIDDTPGISLAEMRTKARRLQMEHGLKLIIVDYLQLIHGRNLENRVQEVSEISQGLKNLARELKIPIIAVSQLSRAVEQRGTRKPQLADLRESGAIEQDADVVMFIYREDPENMKDVTLDIQKHRNGPTGEIKLMFIPERTKFYGMEKSRAKTLAEKAEGSKAKNPA